MKKSMARSEFVITRRLVMLGSTSLVAASLIAGRAFAAIDPSKAEGLVNTAVSDINKIIASQKPERAMLRDFDKVFGKYADVELIALTTLDRSVRSAASNRQKSDYVKAFRSYFTRKYGRRFNEFVGGKITTTGTRSSKNYVEVNSIAKLTGSAPFSVDWRIRQDRRGKLKITNIIIEGINTLTSERVEIGAMLDRRGRDIGKLTAHLKSLG